MASTAGCHSAPTVIAERYSARMQRAISASTCSACMGRELRRGTAGHHPGGEVGRGQREHPLDDLLADLGRLPGLGHRVPRVRLVARTAAAREGADRGRAGRDATRWARIAPQSWATRSTGSPNATSRSSSQPGVGLLGGGPAVGRRVAEAGEREHLDVVRASSARSGSHMRVVSGTPWTRTAGIRRAASEERRPGRGPQEPALPVVAHRAARRASTCPGRGARPGTSDVSRPRIPDGRVTRCQRITSRRRAAAPQAGQNTAWSSSSDRPPWRPSARLGA